MRRRSENAVALVIVLSFVVLLTVAVVAFLSRATTERQVSGSSANSERANLVGLGALDVVVGDLKDEIVASSDATVIGASIVYEPKSTGGVPVGMSPWRTGVPTGGATPIPNLVSRSVRPSDTTSNSPYVAYSSDYTAPPSNRTADEGTDSVSSARTSLNGRSVSLARWNSHYLIPRANSGNTTIESSPVSSFVAPDWVLVSRNGPVSVSGIGTGATAANQPAATNGNYVIGRYAYAVYDEGGMLDVNVAGYPTPAPAPAALPAQRPAFKGGLAFADLTAGVNLPADQINKIVEWRNFASIAAQSTPANTPSGTVTGDGTNYFNAATANDYYNYVRSRSDGFLSVSAQAYPSPATATSRTDHSFTSRQDLLRLRRMTGFSQDALQYLGTFSRDVNAPSFRPTTPSATNPNFAQVLVSAPFTRFDGSDARAGDPLTKRFPLNRLSWLTYRGPSAIVYSTDPSDAAVTQLTAAGVSVSTIQAGTAANIRSSFGLVWDSRSYVAATATSPSVGQQWVYVSPSVANGGGDFDPTTNPAGNPAAAIKRLSTVTAENREPDFFELLRAAILDGSLGQDTGNGGPRGVTGGATVFPDIHMADKTHHTLSIGAAIIDQADPDSMPTRIQFRPGSPPASSATMWWTAYGVESLPYLAQVYPIGGFSPTAGNTTNWATYLLFQLSNPHTGAALSPPAPQVRVRVDGSVGIFTGGNGQTFSTATTPQTVTLPAAGQSVRLTLGVLSPPTSTPAPLTTTLATGPAVNSATAPAGFEVLPPNVTGAASTSIGNYIGLRLLPDYLMAPASSGNAPRLMVHLGTGAATPFNATMEFDAGGGTWIPYNHYVGINDRSSWINGDTLAVRTAAGRPGTPSSTTDQFNSGRFTQSPPAFSLMKPDPRSTRFGVFQIDVNMTTGARITNTLWPTSQATVPNGYGGSAADGTPAVPGNPLEHVPLRFATAPYYPATFCINDGQANSTRNTATTSYADGDGFTRFGDAVYPDPTATNTGSSTPFSSVNYRPIILNRPFRNVGELGYAFRDLPWKSLDLFTERSADAGLLDVFSIVDEPSVVAGHVNANTRGSSVLHTILAGTLWDEVGGSTVTRTTSTVPPAADSAQTMAPIFAGLTATSPTGPLLNRSQIVSKSNFATQVLPATPTTNQPNQLLKARREAIPRALASVAQTRTWNLLIDVIGQSGRYPPTASDLSQFVVEGEKRYWLHVAIDRFTGEVIDQQLEAVYE